MTRAQEAALEAAIEARRQELIAAQTPEKRRNAWYSWSTDASIKSDTRYPVWLKWLSRQRWVPDWLLDIVWKIHVWQ